MQKTQENQFRSLSQEDQVEKEWQPTLIFIPGKFHGQRSLADYSPWGRKVRHNWATKHTHTHTQCIYFNLKLPIYLSPLASSLSPLLTISLFSISVSLFLTNNSTLRIWTDWGHQWGWHVAECIIWHNEDSFRVWVFPCNRIGLISKIFWP